MNAFLGHPGVFLVIVGFATHWDGTFTPKRDAITCPAMTLCCGRQVEMSMTRLQARDRHHPAQVIQNRLPFCPELESQDGTNASPIAVEAQVPIPVRQA